MEGAEAIAAALEHATFPLLEKMDLRANQIPEDVMRRTRKAMTCARQRGRMLLLLGAENGRCESAARGFLRRDGDRAVMCRVLRFMLLGVNL